MSRPLSALALSPAQARITLLRGTRFLSLRANEPGISAPWCSDATDIPRTRYLGNCLAELDRFFLVLLDTLAPVELHGQRNAANRLALHRDADPAMRSDQQRLRALGRSRACLRYCAGTVRRPDHTSVTWMTSGWTDPQTSVLQRYAIGARLAPGRGELLDICRFYDRLADTLQAL